MPDPFTADDANAQRLTPEALLRLERERARRRDRQPLPEGGLFDEVRRNQMELF